MIEIITYRANAACYIQQVRSSTENFICKYINKTGRHRKSKQEK